MGQAIKAPARAMAPRVIGIGDVVVATYPGATFTTVLGSCIAVALRDPVAKVGGLNHFLLATSMDENSRDLRYGDVALPALYRQVCEAGADPSRLEAIVAGGANIIRAMLPIGTENAEFARRWLQDHSIPVLKEDTGGGHARRLSFSPFDGNHRISNVTEVARPDG